MSRFSGKHRGYNHRCIKLDEDYYRIAWTYDKYLVGSRLRWPTTLDRDTDEVGARRFCKKWDIDFPGDKEQANDR